jgi:hypothetical protein
MVVLLGVGKSATINFIFDEVKFGTDAFQMVRFALQMLVKILIYIFELVIKLLIIRLFILYLLIIN